MALDLTTRQAQAPAAAGRPNLGLSTFVRNKIAKMMTGKKADDFVTAVVSLVNNNPDLGKCDQVSLLSSCLQAQSLNLSLNQGMGQCWVVPFKQKAKNGRPEITKATFQIGYKGYIQLAIRSGQYRKLNVLVVKEGELRRWDPLNEEIEIELIENEAERAKAATVGYYAMFEYVNGFRKAMYWSREKMEHHARQYSQAFNMDLRYGKQNSFWSKDFDSMGVKTMLRQLISHWGIMSIEMQMAMTADGKTDDGEYIDGNVLATEYQQPQEAVTVEVADVNPETGEVTEEAQTVDTGEPKSAFVTSDDDDSFYGRA